MNCLEKELIWGAAPRPENPALQHPQVIALKSQEPVAAGGFF